jgi:hypothetical protein
MLENRKTIYDTLGILKRAEAVTSSAAATTDGVGYFDTGGGFTEGKVVFDVTAIKVNVGGTGSESYVLSLQGSNTTTFTSYVNLGSISLGTVGSILYGNVTVKDLTTYVRPFSNKLGDTVYRYLRCYHTITGTVTTGINYSAWLAK